MVKSRKSDRKQAAPSPAEAAAAKLVPRYRSTQLLVELGIHKSIKAAADARCRRSPWTPPWVQISPGKVVYDPVVVEEWLKARAVDPCKKPEVEP